MMNDMESPVVLTDRLLISLVVRISGLALLVLPLFKDVAGLITVLGMGIPQAVFSVSVGLAFSVLIPVVLIAAGEKISCWVSRQPVALDSAAKMLAALAKAVGIILVAMKFESIVALITVEVFNANTPGMRMETSQQYSSIAESALALILGLCLIVYANHIVSRIYTTVADE